MAKKSSSKKRSTKQPAAAAVAVDPKKLQRKLEDATSDYFGWNSQINEQNRLIANLEAQLEVELDKLQLLVKPLQRLDQLMESQEFKKLSASTPYDAALKTAISRVQLKVGKYGKGHKWIQAPTGAKPWSELTRHGATNAQIEKNLRHLDSVYNDGFEFDAKQMALEKKSNRPGVGQVRAKVIDGKDQIIAAVRRIHSIGEPGTAPATVGPKKPAAKKSSKAAKTSVKSKPATVAKKTPAQKTAVRAKSSKPAGSNKKPATKSSSKTAKRSTPPKQKATIEQPTFTDDQVLNTIKLLDQPTALDIAGNLLVNTPAVWPNLDRLVKQKRLTLANGKYEIVEQEVAEGAEHQGKPDLWWLGEIDDDLEQAIAADLPKVWQALKEYGPATDEELQAAKFPRWQVGEVAFFLDELYQHGHAAIDGLKTVAKGSHWATPDEPKKPTSGKATTAGDPLAALEQLGPSATKAIAAVIGKSVDATGSQLRRLLKAGKVKQLGTEWQLAGVVAIDPTTKAADAELNASFEQSLRDRGKKRKAGVEKMVANGWAKAEDVPDEETAAVDSLQNDEAWHQPSGGVVVDRRTKKQVKGFAIAKPK